VLKSAVEGKLSADWRQKHRDIEPASTLLTRILAERRRRWEQDQLRKFGAAGKEPPKNWKAKYEEPAGPNTTNLCPLPEGWCWATVEQLGEVRLGRQRSPKNRARNFPTKYLRAANITEKGFDLSDVLEMEFKPDERTRYQLCVGDLLLSEASGSPDQVGKPAICRKEHTQYCFQNTLIRHRPTLVASEYLLSVYKSYYFNGEFAQIAAGVGINHLSAAKFTKVVVPLPPLAEQEAIVDVVEDQLSVLEHVEADVARTIMSARALCQAILRHAFSGQLARQDPNDEPASELLKRIAIEREERTLQTGSTKKPNRLSPRKRKAILQC
jgi:type I restriction enzyme S subunit